MRISVFDHNEVSFDGLIGTTEIDIENRWCTKHHARCGISSEYSQGSYNLWRDKNRPTEILANICKENGLQTPIYYSNKVKVADVSFYDTTLLATNEDFKEHLSLTALKKIDTVPLIGYKLVPEHVETRSLYNLDYPGIEQGKLQLWVELFEKLDLPAAIDITPEPPKIFEIRLIVWKTADVILNEQNIFGNKMSDIYVKWYDLSY